MQIMRCSSVHPHPPPLAPAAPPLAEGVSTSAASSNPASSDSSGVTEEREGEGASSYPSSDRHQEGQWEETEELGGSQHNTSSSVGGDTALPLRGGALMTAIKLSCYWDRLTYIME